MSGFDGISLPANIFAGLPVSKEAIAQWVPIEFVGVSTTAPFKQVGLLGLLVLVVWFLPNTPEIFRKFSPGLYVYKQELGAPRFLWHTNFIWAVCIALMLFASLKVMCKLEPSEFLYFNF